MEVNIIESVFFKRCGVLKTIESTIFDNSINFVSKLHLYKCKKYKTQNTSNSIIEMGLYFKVEDKDCDFKIALDLFISDKENHFKKYDTTTLNKCLLQYPIDNVDYVCNKIIDSINHNYF